MTNVNTGESNNILVVKITEINESEELEDSKECMIFRSTLRVETFQF